jgi:hypothetical protein
VSIFAEGWEVVVGRTHGPSVIHDRLLGAMLTVDGERIAPVPNPFRWLPTGPGVTGTISGAWPEGALLTLRSDGGLLQLFRHATGSWIQQQPTGHDYHVDYRITAPDSSYIDALTAPAWGGRSLFLARGSSLIGRPLVALGGDGVPAVIGDVATDQPSQAVALPGGDVAVLGVSARPQLDGKAWFVERWRPGGANHAEVEVPGVRWVPDMGRAPTVALCPAVDDAIHLVRFSGASGTLAVLTLRGSTWEADEHVTPGLAGGSDVEVRACTLDSSGSVWAVLAAREWAASPGTTHGAAVFYVRARGTPPVQVPCPQLPAAGRVPDTFRAEGLFMADDGNLWIEGSREHEGVVVVNTDIDGLRPVRRVVLRAGAPLAGTPIQWDVFAPGIIESRLAAYRAQGALSGYDWIGSDRVGPKCERVFVRVRSLTATTSDDDLAAVRGIVRGRKDLSGTRFVEARIENTPVLGAFVPKYEIGTRLLALLRSRGAGSGGRLYCGRPHVVRVIPMDIPDE